MNKPKLRHLPLAAAALVACSGAMAGYTSPDGHFMLSGFGTLGYAKTTTDDAYFNYPGQGTGVKKEGGITPDTKLALQGTYKFAPTFSATGQIMTKTGGQGDYEPSLEWAFAKWQVLPSVAVRVGRMGAPYFAISDFRDVGYANVWVRPPLDVYGQVPVSQVEGLDISHQMNIGPVTLTSTLWGGDSHSQFAVKKYNGADPLTNPSDVDIKRQLGFNLNAEIDGGWTVRAGRVRGKLTAASTGGRALVAALKGQGSATAAQYYAIANAIGKGQYWSDAAYLLGDGISNKEATFTGLAVTYDPGDYVVNLEYTKRTTDSYVSDTTGWYGSFGYRIGKFTPYIGVSQLKSDRRSDNPLTVGGQAVIGGSDSPTIQGYKAAYNAGILPAYVANINAILNTQKLDDKTVTIGTRWDISNGLALKAQFDQISKPENSSGVLNSGTTSFVSESRKIRVLSLSADFVF